LQLRKDCKSRLAISGLTLIRNPNPKLSLFGSEGVAKQTLTVRTNATARPNMSRTAPADTLPPTARAIALLLASTPSVHDAQPGVLHQLLEFAHRYTTQALSDAQVYADHAGRTGKIEMEDVVLAVQARVGWEFGGRVPKEVCILWSLVLISRCSQFAV
jgi:hypothetical protein